MHVYLAHALWFILSPDLSLEMMLGFLSLTAAWDLLLLTFPDTSRFKNSVPSWGFQCSVLYL